MASTTADPFKRPIRTAACLIIGDEILSGNTVDTNSSHFAKYCFNLGIDLKRIETIADDEDEIIEAARRLSARHDLLVTSGGIGSTHDDITYDSLAKAFNSPLALHQETAARMRAFSPAHPNAPAFDWDTPSPQLTARMRMAMLPAGPGTRVLFVAPDLWVPVAVANHNVHVLPGVPRIFVQLLSGLGELFVAEGRVSRDHRPVRATISTPMAETDVAEFLGDLQQRVRGRGVKVGSYPRWGMKHNTITLVGRDVDFIDRLAHEVEVATRGTRVSDEASQDAPGEHNSTEAVAHAEAQKLGAKEAKEQQPPLVDAVAALKIT